MLVYQMVDIAECVFFFLVQRTSITATLHYTATWYQTAPVAAKAFGVFSFGKRFLLVFCFFWGEISMNNAEYVQRLFVTCFMKKHLVLALL